MHSPYYFIVKPHGLEYNNEIEIAGQKVIVNSTVENHKHVNRFAEVVHVPKRYTGRISKGDLIIVHHNIWNSVGDYCFVKPLDIENSYLYEEGLEDNTGFLVYSNNTLLDLGVNEGDKVNFRKDSEYEFEVDGNLLYRMKSSDICTVL